MAEFDLLAEKDYYFSLMPESWDEKQKALAWKFMLILDEHYGEFDSHVIADLISMVQKLIKSSSG